MFIAALTDHCCQLIVKCKYLVIDDLCYKEMYTKQDSSSGKDESDEAASENVAHLRRRLMKSLNYADIGKLTFGKYGAIIINFFIALTQTGFCVNYYIFVGNTLHGFFAGQPDASGSTNTSGNYSHSTPLMMNEMLNTMATGLLSLSPNVSSAGNTTTITESPVFDHSTPHSYSTEPDTMSFTLELSTGAPNTTINSSDILPPTSSTPSGPPLELLVLTPMPIYIIFTLFRNVRQMSVISFIANVSCLIGYGSVLIYILAGKSLFLLRLSV